MRILKHGIFYVPLYVILVVFLITAGSAYYPREVPLQFKEVAMEVGVPATMLYAISVIESGAQPWVLCVKGVGHHYRTREEAYGALKKYRARGITNIDVGIMQINWKYHHRRFLNDWDMLDPEINIRVGAQILHECYEKTGDWLKAVGYYHNPSVRWRAQKYRNKVDRIERSLDAVVKR